MPRRFLLAGKTNHPEQRLKVREQLIQNTINHHTMDQHFQGKSNHSKGFLKSYFKGLLHGYSRFSKSKLLKIRRKFKQIKK
jgi:hypothetical protein